MAKRVRYRKRRWARSLETEGVRGYVGCLGLWEGVMGNIDIAEVGTRERPPIGNNGVKVIRSLAGSCSWDIEQNLAGQAQCNQTSSPGLG